MGKGIQAGMKYEADTGDDLLPHVNAQDTQPPQVTYHHGESCPYVGLVNAVFCLDVVLDFSGYHSKVAPGRPTESDSEEEL